VLVYNAKNTEKKQMWKLVRDSYSILRNKAIFSGVIITITEFLSWCTTLLGLFMGISLLTSYQGESRDGKLGLFVTFAMYSINVIKGIILLLKTLPRIGETLGATRDILTMIDREPQAPEDNVHGALGMLPDLECHDVRLFSFVFSIFYVF
jgi:ABC-type bacteriocin/lantibiotic exporter with double-glycine peptidase domain